MRFSPFLYCALAAAASIATTAIAEPTPVRPFVDAVVRPSGRSVEVQLQQDRCYLWGAVTTDRTGNTFNLTQTVRPNPSGCNPAASNRVVVDLGMLPVGEYRAAYSATAIDMPQITGGTFDFSVRPYQAPRGVLIEPAQPVAFEPIAVRLTRAAGCEHISAFRPIAGGFELEYTQTNFNGMQCDGIDEFKVQIGAYPPGHYLLRVVRPASQGGELLGTAEFDVGSPAPLLTSQQMLDVSGTWNSPDEEPGTAFVFFDSADFSGERPRSGLAGLWYRYDNAGRASWYYLEDSVGTNGARRGDIYEYRSTNPTAPGFQRALAREDIGDFSFVDLGSSALDFRPRVTGNLRGVPFDIRLQRFRWTRAAWAPLFAPP